MKQIIAMGAGRFNNDAAHARMERYLLESAGVTNPHICFVATASGDSKDYIDPFYSAFNQLDCRPSHLPLIRPNTANPAAYLLEQDIIYVGGGNTKNMLALWREWGLDAAMREAYEHGTLLAGWSAGAICWFEGGVTDSIPGDLTALDCLGLLPGSCCPHYTDEGERRPAYERLIADGKLAAGYAIDDGAALHFMDGRMSKVVSCFEGAQAYWVGRENGDINEEALKSEFLRTL